jgi:hypothetical protein
MASIQRAQLFWHLMGGVLMKGRWKLALAALGGLVLMGGARPLLAQDYTAPGPTTLWVDQKTGQVFIRPGHGRVAMSFGANPAQIEQQVEERTEDKVRAAVAETRAQEATDNLALQKQVGEMKPAWSSYMANWQDKFHMGALLYGDYRFYTHTGFQPQELTQITGLGPHNDNFNSFDITRTYLNFYFTPTPDWTLRLTPNMYKTIGSSNDKYGANTGLSSNLDGDMSVRMKYANLQYNGLFPNDPMLKGAHLIIGETSNPLVSWEEDLYGYRFVNLTPWNYLGLSSTQLGISMDGPIKLFGGEKTYIDYAAGVFNNSSFHATEQTSTKQVMARITAYPFGADWRFQGLGLTGFYDYGYGNTTPDSASIVESLKGGDAHITRIAALLHYAAEEWNAVGEFDYGNNAFNIGNLFSGAGTPDAFGTATGKSLAAPQTFTPSCSAAHPCYPLTNTYGPQTAAWTALLGNGQAREIGFDAFGHYHIPTTKITAFGMFQWLMPNDKFRDDPLDFQRFIVGASYQYNEFLRFALDSQNVMFYHNQQARQITYLKQFGYDSPGNTTLNGLLLPTNGSIPFLVPTDTHSIFLNMEFNY